MRRLTVRVLGMLLAVVLASGCLPIGGKGDNSRNGGTDGKESDGKAPAYTNESAKNLVQKLTGSGSLKSALQGTQEALALGGVATWDGEKTLTPATSPVASTRAIPQEVAALALEARQRATAGRLTLARLGDLLKDMGWPFLDSSTPGEQVRGILTGWVADGMNDPDDPLSFTPLFLKEMAAVQQPPVDLAAGDYRPEDLRLTLLELELIAAHFDRISRPQEMASRSFGPGWFGAIASAEEPCSVAKDWWGTTLKDGSVAMDGYQIWASEQVGDGLGAGLQAAGVSAQTAEDFGTALSVLGIVSKFWKLIALYTEAQVAVTIETDNPMHKFQESEGRYLSGFRARAGVSDEDWEAYETAMISNGAIRGLRDCISYFGLPVLPDIGDMAKETKNWTVEWRIPEGAGEHAYLSLDVNKFHLEGQMEMKMQQEGDHAVSAQLLVDITPEKAKSHTGPEREAPVKVEAALETASPPSVGTWFNATQGLMGLVDSLAELGAGWIAEMLPPKAYATLTVTYHEGAAGAWTGMIHLIRSREWGESESGSEGNAESDIEFAWERRAGEEYRSATTITITASEQVLKSQTEESVRLTGDATAILEEDIFDSGFQETAGCEGEGKATYYQGYHRHSEAAGEAPVEATLSINNKGEFTIVVHNPPAVSGTTVTKYRGYYEGAPCLEDDPNDGSEESEPLEDIAWIGEGRIRGKLDPSKPRQITANYTVTTEGGWKEHYSVDLTQHK